MPVLEARASLFAVKHALRRHDGFHRRHLVLSDSISAICALDRGRGKSFGLRRVIQQVGALLLGSGSSCCFRWIPSEWNAADGLSRGSRFASPVPSQLGDGVAQTDMGSSASWGKPKVKRNGRKNLAVKPIAQQKKSTSLKLKPMGPAKRSEKMKERQNMLDQVGTLADASVGATCRLRYQECWNRLVTHTRMKVTASLQPKTVDHHLTNMLNHMFKEGESLSQGQYMVAATLFKLILIPSARQALAGWRKMDPPLSRLPLPYEVVALMASHALDHNSIQGLIMLVCFECYLRPPVSKRKGVKQAWSLKLHPIELGVAPKASEFDETVVFDLPEFAVVAETIYRARSSKGGNRWEWPILIGSDTGAPAETLLES